MKHISIRVTGKVQGVFFRASAVSAAQQIGVRGFVRNEPDGSVYLEVEGSDEQLNALVAWCKIGPPRARVDEVQVNESITLYHFNDFKIIR
ncbi:MAG: acylphosphatase [Cyclobacteriaceae bacterium]|nr:acylphosphatase [Cyclobacteriaceae bacterium]UYN87329.1 MAG: acylphosphatase [Cyclobacteriaceae bacterium]